MCIRKQVEAILGLMCWHFLLCIWQSGLVDLYGERERERERECVFWVVFAVCPKRMPGLCVCQDSPVFVIPHSCVPGMYTYACARVDTFKLWPCSTLYHCLYCFGRVRSQFLPFPDRGSFCVAGKVFQRERESERERERCVFLHSTNIGLFFVHALFQLLCLDRNPMCTWPFPLVRPNFPVQKCYWMWYNTCFVVVAVTGYILTRLIRLYEKLGIFCRLISKSHEDQPLNWTYLVTICN